MLLDASILINDSFIKPSNPLSEKNIDKVWDFNKLPEHLDENSWIAEFCRDLLEYTNQIATELGETPTVLYIHGLKDRGDLGIDMGIGVRLRDKQLTNVREYAEIFLSSQNTAPGGSVIADIRRSLRLKNYWNSRLKKEKWYSVWIGEIYFAGRPEQLPQIHKNLKRPADSIQIEINRTLRENIDYTVSLLSDWLTSYDN